MDEIVAKVQVLCKYCGQWHELIRGGIAPYYTCSTDGVWVKTILLQEGDIVDYEQAEQ